MGLLVHNNKVSKFVDIIYQAPKYNWLDLL